MTASESAHAVTAHVAVAAGGARLLASGDGDLGAGFIAFVVVVVLGVACYFLFKSMSRHLAKVPSSFDPPTDSRPSTPADSDDA